jgi:hypothetical protein
MALIVIEAMANRGLIKMAASDHQNAWPFGLLLGK